MIGWNRALTSETSSRFPETTRTGMLIMLLQSIVGVSDHSIVQDYFASDNMMGHLGSAAAVAALGGERQYGRLDRILFSRATREAMVSTLEYLRLEYGSISPGYLDHIGFNKDWRRRIRCHLKRSNDIQASKM